MMGIGFPELMIILVIIMIIFGAGKLPEIGSAFGRSIKNFKSSMKEAEESEAARDDRRVHRADQPHKRSAERTEDPLRIHHARALARGGDDRGAALRADRNRGRRRAW